MEDTRLESDLLKSLDTLDSLLKGQIQVGSGSEPKKWPGGETEDYDADTDAKWDDDIDDNGTDYNKKGMKKSAGEDVEPYEDDETQEEVEEPEEKKPAAKSGKKPPRKGVEVSEFLSELSKAIAGYGEELGEMLVKSISELHNDHGVVLHGLAQNLDTMNTRLEKSQQNITAFADAPVGPPKSALDMASVPSIGDLDKSLDRDQILGLLIKGVEEQKISPLEVIKFESLGPSSVSPALLKSLTA